ncbi:sulfate transporter 4 [Prunus dulcis]|uniref:Sulfate transporter 4 n=1 Tax=Prunus dulcis TaxID=3755 RepID=A0A4Y1QNM8_PRUDU|nr:sulfate transporter 4 [Prunus dulcis]
MWLLKSSIQSCTFAAAVLVAAAAVPVAAATASVPLLHRSHDLPPRPSLTHITPLCFRHTQHKPDQEPPQPPPLPKGKTRKYLRYVRAAGPLTAVLSGTIFVKIFNPSSISLVGDIPQGLPSFSIPRAFGYATSLIPTALLITGVAILESVGIAKALAAKNGYELDSNQEVLKEK